MISLTRLKNLISRIEEENEAIEGEVEVKGEVASQGEEVEREP
jgi:hypothetical protein